MQDKTVIVTGANSGVGLEAADVMARAGASLILVCRDRGRGEAAVARIARHSPPPRLLTADLSRLAEVERLAESILSSTPQIDVLVNNAGAMFPTRQLSADGIEQTFALNHMAYFVLTNLLLERILANAPARVVSVASAGHRHGALDFSDLQNAQDYDGWRTYSRSKLANILFTRALARRLEGSAVTANCLHPGLVRTPFFEKIGGFPDSAVGLTPAAGARTIVYVASSPEVEGISGEYFVKCRVTRPAKAAYDDDAGERLWAESLRLVNMAGSPALQAEMVSAVGDLGAPTVPPSS